MLTLDYVKEHLTEITNDVLDARFLKRLLDFMPISDWEKFGFGPGDGLDVASYNPKYWTEENVLAQLKADLEFGIEKAVNHRGISASLMYDCVRGWCIVLENGLENTDYGWYGDKLFKAVDEKYDFNLVGDKFDKEFYEEW